VKVIVDIGNSNVVIGIYDVGTWRHLWRMPTITSEDAQVYYNLEIRNRLLETGLDVSNIEGIILSTVVPFLRETFKYLLRLNFGLPVYVVGPDLYNELQFEVPRPYEIGTDIVANAYCAYKKHGGQCIVVDFGTALTFTTVDPNGLIKGVAIAPGIKTAMKALSSNTAQLPEIPLKLPESVLGMNTTHALQAGILWGYVGLVRQLLLKVREEVGENYTALATGGLSFVMSEVEDMFQVIDRELTMTGLLYMLRDSLKIGVDINEEE
jgi:type III pantothenate kinase